jgi:hypothetical protein
MPFICSGHYAESNRIYEKGVKIALSENVNLTMHNCLIDCHAEVWTHFPVLPAVQRQTISSSSERSRKTLVFVSDCDHQLFLPHFVDMIQTFEQTTRKLTGKELKTVLVSAMSFSTFTSANIAPKNWTVSRFRTGRVSRNDSVQIKIVSLPS